MIVEMEEWGRLKEHYEKMKNVHIRELFQKDPDRAKRFRIEDAGIYFDYSKNIITDETIRLLIDLANACSLKERIEDMFEGRTVNVTEGRPALHTALRNMSENPVYVEGKDVMPEIKSVLKKMMDFSERIRSGEKRGYTGKRIRNVVNIGIGGSHLGPSLACKALYFYSKKDIKVSFLSNIDPSQFVDVLSEKNWEETIFLITSKTFTTFETLENAKKVISWFLERAGKKDALKDHFYAITANKEKAVEFGIPEENVFLFWEWVGGRYSLTSAVGLPVMIAIGKEKFLDMLYGFYSMDNHFRYTPFEKNIPVILALISIWYNNFFGAETHAIIPYDYCLREFPSYVQQLEMESCGKCVDNEGKDVPYKTGQIIWGGVGTDCQHSFFQLLHQGKRFVPVDFIGFFTPLNRPYDQHKKLLANMFAQSEALAFGKDDPVPYRRIPGGRPSNIILQEKLTPSSLGRLISLYEHKVFVQSVIWNINPFDQFGVELGKRIAKEITDELFEGKRKEHDPSTRLLIEKAKSYISKQEVLEKEDS